MPPASSANAPLPPASDQPRRSAVVYRKGELSKATIDRNWPHQVALPAAHCSGANATTIRLFCEDERLSLCVRGHSFRRDDLDVIVFCFAEQGPRTTISGALRRQIHRSQISAE